MEIKTKNLLLRRLKDSSKNLQSIPYPYTLKEANQRISYFKEDSEDLVLGIEYNRKIIGEILLLQINKLSKNAFLHFTISKPYQRKGIGYEAASAVLNFALKNLGLKTIESLTFKENLASQKLLEKLGFRYQHLLQKHLSSQATGETHDVMTYLLKKE